MTEKPIPESACGKITSICGLPLGHAAEHEKYIPESELQARLALLLQQVAAHQMHLMFSIADGRIVKASCACGVEFNASKPQCPQWQQRILSISPDLDAALAAQIASAEAKGRRDALHDVENDIGIYIAKFMQSRTPRVEIGGEILSLVVKRIAALEKQKANGEGKPTSPTQDH